MNALTSGGKAGCGGGWGLGLPYSCKGDRDDCQNSLEENLTTGYQNLVLGQSSGTVRRYHGAHQQAV